MDLVALPGRLRELREERGLTQEQLAEKAGVRRATISDIERGESKPDLQTIAKLADALGLAATVFFQSSRPRRGR